MASPSYCPEAARISCSRHSASPRRRRVARSGLVFSAVAILASLASTVSASPTGLQPQITAPAVLHSAQVIPRRDAQLPRHNEDPTVVVPAAEHEWLRRSDSKDEDEDEKTSSTRDEKTSSVKDKDEDKTSSSRRQTSTETESETPTTTRPSPTAQTSTAFPSPFDPAPVTNDFTAPGGDDSCSKFIFNLLSDATFQTCYPVSMLIETSARFFEARKQLLDVVRVLDRSCKSDLTFCGDYLDKAARDIMAEENCRQELDAPNLPPNAPILQAYRGLRAYKELYKTTCLFENQDDDTEMYCYAKAATNSTDPSDGYLYWLPLGMDYPGSSVPSCNQCTRDTMGIFRDAAADRSQLISKTYLSAAQQINTLCGVNFVDASLPDPDESLGSQTLPSYIRVVLGVCVILAMNLAL